MTRRSSVNPTLFYIILFPGKCLVNYEFPRKNLLLKSVLKTAVSL